MADKYLKVAASLEHIDDGAAVGPTPYAATLLPAIPDVYSIYHDQFTVMRVRKQKRPFPNGSGAAWRWER